MREPENDYHLRFLAEIELNETIAKFNGDRNKAIAFLNDKSEIKPSDVRDFIRQQLENK